jgi:CBS domain-containing protein
MVIDQIIRNSEHTVKSVTPETTIRDAARVLANNKIGLVVVCGGGDRLLGVLSERDIVRAISAYDAEAMEMTTQAFMTADVATCEPKDHAHDALARMNERNIRHMPVVKDGTLKGLVSSRDILRSITELASPEEQAMMWAKIVHVA